MNEILEAYGETQGVYHELERIVREELTPEFQGQLIDFARGLGHRLDFAQENTPILMTHKAGWLLKKLHEVLDGEVAKYLQSELNETLGFPPDYRG